jgi:membrane protease YdiL (CAAX protease family)
LRADDSNEPGPDAPSSLAPRRHTAALVALIVSVATAGLLLGRTTPTGAGVNGSPGAASRILNVYLPLIVVQVGLVLYVARIGRRSSALTALIGRRWTTFRRAALDVAIAAVGFGAVYAVEATWSSALGVNHNAPAAFVLPHGVAERLVFVAVALAVGFGEEVVYRGYLLVQLGAFSGSVMAGVVLQGVLFGLAHADQGIAAALRLTLYGIGFGAMARARRSLLPSMLAHAAIDLCSGLLHGG